MIPVNARKCNILPVCKAQKSEALINRYKAYIQQLDTFQLECNYCHEHGYCIRHAYYKRGYFIDKSDLCKGTAIDILRVKCKNCGHTHAILPEEIVPYLQYTAAFISEVLKVYFSHSQTVERICDTYEISVTTLYNWKERFLSHKDQYLGVLKSMMCSPLEALASLHNLKDYVADFADRFLRWIEKMPMQRHQNPPNTERPVFS